MADAISDTSVLSGAIALKGVRVLDIGSGDGALVRYLTGQGARATGLECGAAQLAKARAAPRVGDEEYVEGFAQQLPFGDAEFDLTIFFNSLHHVPVEHMATALSEAARVSKPGGMIYVAEPVAAGSGFELHAPVDDETGVRSAAYEAIRAVDAGVLVAEREVFYDTVYHYRDFDAFREEMIRIDPRRLAPFDAMQGELRDGFDRLGVREARGVRFDQPMRVNVLRKP